MLLAILFTLVISRQENLFSTCGLAASWVFRCQAKFRISAKFLTYFCLSVILLLRVKNLNLAFSFLMCVV